MKRVVLLLVLFGFLFVSALDEPNAGVGEGDVEAIQDAVEIIPLDPDSGEIDFEKYKPFKTRADERIAKINGYVGPITRTLFGVELTLSFVFVFSVLLWLLLIEIIIMPVSEIFDWDIWWSLLGSGIIATLAMQGFGKNLVIWVNLLVSAWYVGLVAIIVGAAFGVVYKIAMRFAGDKVKAMKKESDEARTEQDRAVLHADAEVAKKDLKSRT